MSGYLSTFTSHEGENEYRSAYDAVMKRWTVPYEELDIPTSFGITHVIASGSKSLPPLLLLHACGASAAMWFPNAASLSRVFRVLAVDIIGEPGKSRQSRLFQSHEDCANWLCELIEGLGLTLPNIVGSSYGGWHALNFSIHCPNQVNRIVVLAPGASVLPFSWPVLLMLRLIPYLPVKPNPLKRFFGKDFHVDESFARQFELGIKHFRYADPKESIFTNVFQDRELQGIHTPVLFLAGENEVIYNPVAAIDKVKKSMPGAQAKMIPGAGHLLSMEQPARVNDCILKFLR